MPDLNARAARDHRRRERAAARAHARVEVAVRRARCSTMPQGVPLVVPGGDPYPIYLREGKGSRVWDVDGNEYVDFHNGFGSMVVGHAHPKVAEAIEQRRAHRHALRRADRGDRAASPRSCAAASSVEQVRFCNSGTEATMSAIRIARAATGREHIVKIEGSYHGHHDTVMFSVVPNSDMMGGREAPATDADVERHPDGDGRATRTSSRSTTSRCSSALLDERGDEIACLILEPVMMNIGIASPSPATSQGLKDLLHKHGALLIFDEVKSGATVAARRRGRALRRASPTSRAGPRRSAAARPAAAFGGRADVMDAIDHGAAQQGTFNGNPLVAAAGLATLTEVLTPDAYEYLAKLGTRLAEGCARAMAENGIPGHAVDLGAKGCVSYRPEPLRNYRDFLETNPTSTSRRTRGR